VAYLMSETHTEVGISPGQAWSGSENLPLTAHTQGADSGTGVYGGGG
jgi:hypothetical protein